MIVRFLLDENISPKVRAAILRRYPHIDVLRVGDPGAPPLATLDPAILQYLEQSQRLLVTKNRASMPGHVSDHLDAGGTHWGIFRVRPNSTFSQILETLNLVVTASDAEEWINQMWWIPF